MDSTTGPCRSNRAKAAPYSVSTFGITVVVAGVESRDEQPAAEGFLIGCEHHARGPVAGRLRQVHEGRQAEQVGLRRDRPGLPCPRLGDFRGRQIQAIGLHAGWLLRGHAGRQAQQGAEGQRDGQPSDGTAYLPRTGIALPLRSAARAWRSAGAGITPVARSVAAARRR